MQTSAPLQWYQTHVPAADASAAVAAICNATTASAPGFAAAAAYPHTRLCVLPQLPGPRRPSSHKASCGACELLSSRQSRVDMHMLRQAARGIEPLPSICRVRYAGPASTAKCKVRSRYIVLTTPAGRRLLQSRHRPTPSPAKSASLQYICCNIQWPRWKLAIPQSRLSGE